MLEQTVKKKYTHLILCKSISSLSSVEQDWRRLSVGTILFPLQTSHSTGAMPSEFKTLIPFLSEAASGGTKPEILDLLYVSVNK